MTAANGSLFSWPRRDAPAEEILRWGLAEFRDKIAISTSFQATGMVILDMAACITGGNVKVFSLDTGRLHSETYELIEQVRRRYGIQIELLHPDGGEVGRMTSLYGPNLFYDDVSRRRLCCEIRKVRPLNRKLATLDAWVVGLRRSQGSLRESTDTVSLDHDHGGIVKVSPLAHWSDDEVWDYVKRNDVPMHKLYDQGYPSIGCAPCTRPTKPGESPRAGRWWWEDSADKECGIHISPDGSVRSSFDVLLEEVLPAAPRTR